MKFVVGIVMRFFFKYCFFIVIVLWGISCKDEGLLYKPKSAQFACSDKVNLLRQYEKMMQIDYPPREDSILNKMESWAGLLLDCDLETEYFKLSARLAHFQIAKGNNEKGKLILYELISQHPEDNQIKEKIYYHLATSYRKTPFQSKNNIRKALYFIEKAQKEYRVRMGGEYNYTYLLTKIYILLSLNWEEALAYLEKCLEEEIISKNRNFYYVKALIYREAKFHKKELLNMKIADSIGVSTGALLPVGELGVSLRNNDYLEEAKKELMGALTLSPNKWAQHRIIPHINLAKLYVKEHNAEKAMMHVDSAYFYSLQNGDNFYVKEIYEVYNAIYDSIGECSKVVDIKQLEKKKLENSMRKESGEFEAYLSIVQKNERLTQRFKTSSIFASIIILALLLGLIWGWRIQKNKTISLQNTQKINAQLKNKIQTYAEILEQIPTKYKELNAIQSDTSLSSKELEFNNKLKAHYPSLTLLECKHAFYIQKGLSIKEVAEKLYITPQSVSTYRLRLRKKLDFDSLKSFASFLEKI